MHPAYTRRVEIIDTFVTRPSGDPVGSKKKKKMHPAYYAFLEIPGIIVDTATQSDELPAHTTRHHDWYSSLAWQATDDTSRASIPD